MLSGVTLKQAWVSEHSPAVWSCRVSTVERQQHSEGRWQGGCSRTEAMALVVHRRRRMRWSSRGLRWAMPTDPDDEGLTPGEVVQRSGGTPDEWLNGEFLWNSAVYFLVTYAPVSYAKWLLAGTGIKRTRNLAGSGVRASATDLHLPVEDTPSRPPDQEGYVGCLWLLRHVYLACGP
jgi:hypothetical protein